MLPDDRMPQNLQAERAVIGACLISREAQNDTIGMLKTEDFYNPNNRGMWKVITEMYNSDMSIDIVTISDELKRQGMFERIGGVAYLNEVMREVTTTALAVHHAEIILDYAFRRRLLEASDKISKLALKYDTDRTNLLGEVERVIFEASDSKDKNQPSSLNELTPPAFQKVDEAYRGEAKAFTGYSSGFEDLNRIISGFQPGSLNIIAARPSMGKTALALNIAQFGGNIEVNPYVLVFSLEMTSEQLVHRMLASSAKVNVSAMTKGKISEYEFMRLKEAADSLTTRNIYIHDTSNLTAMDFHSICRRFKLKHPELALIVVDYIQLMHSGNRRPDTRQTEVAEISRLLKSVALEMNCPVIALSQLSRETERRTEKKPQLWDLRDSGAIEQDADVVMLLYRESYYGENENTDVADDVTELRIAKNRNGATGICKLIFQREYTRFVGYAEEE